MCGWSSRAADLGLGPEPGQVGRPRPSRRGRISFRATTRSRLALPAPVDDAHPAAAQLLQQLVVAEIRGKSAGKPLAIAGPIVGGTVGQLAQHAGGDPPRRLARRPTIPQFGRKLGMFRGQRFDIGRPDRRGCCCVIRSSNSANCSSRCAASVRSAVCGSAGGMGFMPSSIYRLDRSRSRRSAQAVGLRHIRFSIWDFRFGIEFLAAEQVLSNHQPPIPNHQSPTHQSPTHQSPTHQSPTHQSPTHQSPTHQSPTHRGADAPRSPCYSRLPSSPSVCAQPADRASNACRRPAR